MSLLGYSNQPALPENLFVELSTMLSTRTTAEINASLGDQDVKYLVALCNKAVVLEHYEVCAVIVSLLEEKISCSQEI